MLTLALAGGIDAIHKYGGTIAADWQKRLPHNSSPYTSTIERVVRQGNPKAIRYWDDLIKPGTRFTARSSVRPKARVSAAPQE